LVTWSLLVLGRLLGGPLDLRRASRDAAVGLVQGPLKPTTPLFLPRLLHQLHVAVGADDRLGHVPLGDPPGCRPSLPRAGSSGRLVSSHHPARFAPCHSCTHVDRQFLFDCSIGSRSPFTTPPIRAFLFARYRYILRPLLLPIQTLRCKSLICAVFPLPSADC